MRRARGCLLLSGMFILLLPPMVGASEDTLTVALWHCDETEGSVLYDSSEMGRDVYLYGTLAVNGVIAKARHFNGGWDYGWLDYPASRFLDMSDVESFEISLWIRTTASEGIIIRRGLAPVPGILIGMRNGHVVGMIGNREDGSYPDTLLEISSGTPLNDGVWHCIAFMRDRQARTINLSIDGVPEQPVPDPITFALANDRPLTFGRWESEIYPGYYFGDLDEIKISVWGPAVSGADTLLLLRFDETPGDPILDESVYGHAVYDYGTSRVDGFSGSARLFDGMDDYLDVREAADGAFGFAANESFTIDCRFRTIGPGYQILMRKGLAPIPGFALEMMNGHVRGLIGNREDGTPPDTVLDIRSAEKYNDGLWHRATLVRDRERHVLALYVDGMAACPPMEDLFEKQLVNSVDLNIGRWEFDYYNAAHFGGALDDIGIYRGARHPAVAASIRLSDSVFVFPRTLVGDTVEQAIRIDNFGLDTLRVTLDLVSDPAFSAMPPSPIPPLASAPFVLKFHPVAVEAAVGVVELLTNDPAAPIVRLHARGQGVAPGVVPLIRSVLDIPQDQGKQVRVSWYRSSLDEPGSSGTVSEYTLWRRVPAMGAMKPGPGVLERANEVWDFIATVPAAGFSEYAFVAPTLVDSSKRWGMHWSVFLVVAMIPGQSPQYSEPDSGYSLDNLPPGVPNVWSVTSSGGEVDVRWEAPADKDLMDFVVERSVSPGDPGATDVVGVVITTSYHDAAPPGPRVYYRILARDSAGNASAGASWVEGLVLSVSGDSELPRAFVLYPNFPNPFNPGTVIRYAIPAETHTTLEVYNSLGQRVRELVSETQRAGYYDLRFDAGSLPSGVYFARLAAGSFRAVTKMFLVK